MATRLQPAHADSLPQRIEDIALTTAIRTPPSTATEICEKVAKWIRLNFKPLQTSPHVSPTLTRQKKPHLA